MRDMQVVPAPTDEEAVAIVAAIEALWPQPAGAMEHSDTRTSSWRFSGRWWSAPLPIRRSRPWR